MNIEQLRELWPTLSDEDLRIADEALTRYLEIAWDICENEEREHSSLS